MNHMPKPEESLGTGERQNLPIPVPKPSSGVEERHAGLSIGKSCPSCAVDMEHKAWLPIESDSEGRGGYTVCQCPNCKNIEIESC